MKNPFLLLTLFFIEIFQLHFVPLRMKFVLYHLTFLEPCDYRVVFVTQKTAHRKRGALKNYCFILLITTY